jgi:RNA polymerase sigma-70 factor (ECF subfamily)
LFELAAPTERDDAGEDLRAALAWLPRAQAEVVVMRFTDEMSLEEIAQALSIPLGTVKSRLHHALAALREHPRTRRWHTE